MLTANFDYQIEVGKPSIRSKRAPRLILCDLKFRGPFRAPHVLVDDLIDAFG